MSLASLIPLYIATIPLFIALDLLWLGVVAKGLYQEQLSHLLGPIRWPAAFVFYAVFVAGIIFFAVYPALEKQSLVHAALLGALFGFFCYATYDLTNMATLKNWPLMITLVDIVWGAVLCSAVASGSYLIATKLLG